MKLTLCSLLLVTSLGLSTAPGARAAENVADALAGARTGYQADRQAKLAEMMHFTEAESAAFWPLYRSYRADVETLGDGLIKLVLEYSDLYPNVPDDRAQQMVKDYTDLEEKLAKKRAWYYRRAAKLVPAAKVLRWAQIENRMDLMMRMQMAGAVPLAPK